MVVMVGTIDEDSLSFPVGYEDDVDGCGWDVDGPIQDELGWSAKQKNMRERDWKIAMKL